MQNNTKSQLKNAGKAAGYVALIAAGIVALGYTSKKLRELSDYVEEHGGCKQAANDALYQYIPKEEELGAGGKYEGVGTNFKWPLTRTRCESCLEFLDRAREKIPEQEALKQTVISDIRRSASTDSLELNRFYQDIFSWQYSDIEKVRILTDCAILADQVETPVTLSGEKYS
jgi:hypothetical protein